MRTWMKRGLIGVGVVALLGMATLSKLKPVEVETVSVKKQDVITSVLEKGKITNENNHNVYAEVQGKVVKLYGNVGDRVTKGTLLAQLDVEELTARLNQLKGELKSVSGSERAAQSQSGTNQIKQQKALVASAKLAVQQAQSNYNRTMTLYKEGATTAVEVEESRNTLETAQKDLEQAEAALGAITKQSQSNTLQFQGQKESLQAQIDHLSAQISKSKIYAPDDGVIFIRKLEAGDFVNPGTLIYTIGSSGEKVVETWINSKDMANVRVGQEATVIFKTPGEDQKTVAKIEKIAPVTEEKTSSLGLQEDRIKVTLALTKMPTGVSTIPGTSVDVQVITNLVKGVLAVPKEAVFTDNGQDYLWVQRAGKATLIKVQTGLEGDTMLEIKQGLRVGDQVITNPHDPNLKEGAKVS